MTTTLRGMAWDHPQVRDPLAAISAEWTAGRGVPVTWDARPSQDIEDQRPEELATAYDLILIDQPLVAAAAGSGLIAPVDDWVDAIATLLQIWRGTSHHRTSSAGCMQTPADNLGTRLHGNPSQSTRRRADSSLPPVRRSMMRSCALASADIATFSRARAHSSRSSSGREMARPTPAWTSISGWPTSCSKIGGSGHETTMRRRHCR